MPCWSKVLLKHANSAQAIRLRRDKMTSFVILCKSCYNDNSEDFAAPVAFTFWNPFSDPTEGGDASSSPLPERLAAWEVHFLYFEVLVDPLDPQVFQTSMLRMLSQCP